LKRAETCCAVKHAAAISYSWLAETCCGLLLLDASYSYKNDYSRQSDKAAFLLPQSANRTTPATPRNAQ